MYNVIVKIKKGESRKELKMKKYKVLFKSDELNKTYTITVKALGIITAIEEAIRKMICKPTFGAFYYPIKAEEVEA